MNQMRLRLSQLLVGSPQFLGKFGSFAQVMLQRCILGLELKMKMASLQKILHSKLYFGPVERLGKKVMGAMRERLGS